ncbi:MAG: sugar phosphate isomerase/epimerase family protein [Actinomycetota bacterium]
MKIKKDIEYGTTIALWGPCPDRFLAQGYRKDTTFEQKIELISQIEEIKGVDLYGDWDVNMNNVDKVKKTLDEANLKTLIVTADVNSIPEFGRGSVASPLKASRELGWQKVKEAIDMAEILGSEMVDLWFGQDGYDYSFQTDYLWGWERIIQTIKDAAHYAGKKGIKIALEYKPREPRTHIYTATAAKMLFAAGQTGMDNVGILIDTGHGYTAGENISESVAICKLAGDKLFYVHVNDNYKVWDDDMMVGSVHPFEMVEFLYWLEKTGYEGPIVLDMFPFREEPLAAARESIDFIKQIRRLLEGIEEEEIEELFRKQDAVEAMKFLRKNIIR